MQKKPKKSIKKNNAAAELCKDCQIVAFLHKYARHHSNCKIYSTAAMCVESIQEKEKMCSCKYLEERKKVLGE